MLVFNKELVLKSIKEAGNEDKITKDVIDDLDNYEGCEAVKSSWDSLVNDMELFIVKGKNGEKIKVEKRFLTETN